MLLTNWLSRFSVRSVRISRRNSRRRRIENVVPAQVESLEDRQLLSAVNPTMEPDNIAIPESTPDQKAEPPIFESLEGSQLLP